MKYLLFAAGLLVAPLAGRAQIMGHKVDADFGFSDMKLTSAIAAHPELIYAGLGGDNDPNLRYYERRDEALVFDGVPLSSVRYAYYKGKLGSMILQADAKHRSALRKAVLAHYGKPIRWSEAYEWNGQRATVVLIERDATVSSLLIASNEFKRMTQSRMKSQGLE